MDVTNSLNSISSYSWTIIHLYYCIASGEVVYRVHATVLTVVAQEVESLISCIAMKLLWHQHNLLEVPFVRGPEIDLLSSWE